MIALNAIRTSRCDLVSAAIGSRRSIAPRDSLTAQLLRYPRSALTQLPARLNEHDCVDTNSRMRGIAIAALLLSLAPAAAARAQDRQCVPRPVVEDPLQQAVSARRALGFNADPAYVRTLKRTYPSPDYGPIPVTSAEAHYLRARDRLRLGAAERRYLRSLGDDYAGYRLKDAWPHPAYLLLHFTRDPRGHLAALKRIARFPRTLRADRVRYTLRTLRRLQDRISDDGRFLQRA